VRDWLLCLIKPSAKTAGRLILALMLLVMLFGAAGYWEPVREFVEQENLALQAGHYRISLYAIAKALLTVAALFWCAAILSEFGERRIERIKIVRAANRALLTKLFQILLYFVAFLMTMDIIGVDLSALAIFGGAAGIGIGFGLQKIASNFISGLILLFEKSVEKDDLIELSDGMTGFVRHMAARHILIETADGREVIVPNEDFIVNRVVNWTYSDARARVDIPVRVSYRSDVEKAYELMLEAANEHPNCLPDPAPACFLRGFGENSVDFLLLFWIGDVVQGRYRPQSETLFAIWRKFREHNIEIPAPQREVRVLRDDAPFVPE
jgi:small-conductance mechanosensitive channel